MLTLPQQFFVDHDTHICLSFHFKEYARVDLVLFNVVPDNSVDDVSCEVTQSELPLRAKHNLTILLLADMRFNSISDLFLIASVH